MATYLIMRCEDGDEELYREPETLTNNWKNWFETNKPDFNFEVYEFDGTEFTRIKRYDAILRRGMALVKVYSENAEDVRPEIIKEYPDRTRYASIPYNDLEQYGDFCGDPEYEVPELGFVCIEESNDGKDYWYCYGEYENYFYDTGV